MRTCYICNSHMVRSKLPKDPVPLCEPCASMYNINMNTEVPDPYATPKMENKSYNEIDISQIDIQ